MINTIKYHKLYTIFITDWGFGLKSIIDNVMVEGIYNHKINKAIGMAMTQQSYLLYGR